MVRSGLGLGEGDGEEAEEGEEDSEGVGEDFGFERRDGFSDAEGEGDTSCNGLTGPVGFRGGAMVGFGEEEGVGVGAAKRSEAARQSSSVLMKRRNLMGAAERQP